MSEWTIEVPADDDPVELWQNYWDEIIRMDHYDYAHGTDLVGEVFEAIYGVEMSSHRKTCPFVEGSACYEQWCAILYAAEIGADYRTITKMARELAVLARQSH
jgi:hypothetical protein